MCFDGPQEELAKTEFAQPAIFTVSCISLAFAREMGLTPVVVAGHSLGEYSALVAAGVCDFEAAISVVCERGRLMAAAARPGDGMAAVLGLDLETVRGLLDGMDDVAIANINCPGQIVISGSRSAIDGVEGRLKGAGARGVVSLAVSGAFHTEGMREANDRLAPLLARIVTSDAQVPVVQNASGQASTKAADVLASLERQMVSPVLWEDSVATMASIGVDTYVELGPGTVLKGLVRRCRPDAIVVNGAEPKALLDLGERMRSA